MNRRTFIQALVALIVAPKEIVHSGVPQIHTASREWILGTTKLGYATRLGVPNAWVPGELITIDMMNEMRDLSISAIRKDSR